MPDATWQPLAGDAWETTPRKDQPMPNDKILRCNLLTPDRQVVDCDATFVAIPAHDGQMGFLSNRGPLLCKLGVGELRIESGNGRRRFFIEGGFAQMLHNQLSVLTERAEAAEEIDRADADTALQEMLALPAGDSVSRAAKDAAVERARARLRVAGS